eukprot:4688630-Pyramimonas_sp.AAC.1
MGGKRTYDWIFPTSYEGKVWKKEEISMEREQAMDKLRAQGVHVSIEVPRPEWLTADAESEKSSDGDISPPAHRFKARFNHPSPNPSPLKPAQERERERKEHEREAAPPRGVSPLPSKSASASSTSQASSPP